MTTSDNGGRRALRGGAIAMLALAAALSIGAILLLWAWNTLAAGLAHLPRAEFKHALAFELAVAVVAATAIASARWIAGRGAAAPARDPR
ncbi:MAG: hypothetical protein JNM29_01785 [Candidatus Odyssella sp.]|nr:hypothetical protein [Candidatus Odyssella sp.]